METKNTKNFLERAATHSDLMLKKHVGLIHCENKLTFLQRKVGNILLFNALDRINLEDIHLIPLRQLCNLIGYRSHDFGLIKSSIKSLISTVMEWNLLDDNKFIKESNLATEALTWNASSLLAGASIEKGVVRYSYSPQIKKVLSSLEIYGRINLFVQSKLNSSYSLVLYENCVRFKNIGRTCWFPLDLFRSLMGLMNGQYKLFKELKRNVITLAMNEINQKSDIYIDAEYQKTGRAISGIQFHISDNLNYQPSFKKMTKSAASMDVDHQSDSSVMETLIENFDIKTKQAKELIYKYDLPYLSEKMELVKNSKKVDNPSAYLLAAIKNDYKDSKKGRTIVQGVQNTYLRETDDASQIRSLKKKYLEYKYRIYIDVLMQQALLEKAQEDFIANYIIKNPIIGSIYKKKGLQSQPAMSDFIDYINKVYPEIKVEYLPFDEYVMGEVVV